MNSPAPVMLPFDSIGTIAEPMKRDDLLDLSEALQHPGKKIAVDLETELPEEAEIDLIEPVTGFLEAVSTGNMLLIEGEFRTRCVVECARCGAPLEVDVNYRMEEQVPVEGVASAFASDDFARVVPEEDYPIFEGNSLMVEALIRQGLLVHLPMQPLCEFGWDGPCPEALSRLPQTESETGHPELQRLRLHLQKEEGTS